MQPLRNKSEINLHAAELLHKNHLYPAVVHCAYYSCFQLMKHIWLTAMNKTEEDLSQLNRNSHEGSHELLINKLKMFIKSKSLDDRAFNNSIIQLKRLRIKADYENSLIDSDKSYNSISLSKETQIVLKKCL